MTICLLTNDIESTGGVKTFNQHFVELFTSFQHHVVLLTTDASLNKDDDIIEKLTPLFTKVTLKESYRNELKKIRSYFRPGGCNAPNIIAAGNAMHKWLIQNHLCYNIDIVEASDHGGLGIFVLNNKLPPVVLTNHASVFHLSKYNHACTDEHGRVVKELELRSYQKCSAIFTHSSILKKELAVLTSKPIFNLKIPWIKKLSAATVETNNYGIVVGQFQVIKGAILFSQTLDQIAKQKMPIQIKWFGNDTKTLKGHKSVESFLKYKYPVIWKDHLSLESTKSHELILEEIASAKYIIVPSLWETFNYVVLEAASLGKAIIITNTTGASCLFTNNVNALIVAPDSYELAEAILKLETNPALRNDLGKNAMKLIEQIFQPAQIVDERIRAYHEAIMNHNQACLNSEDNLKFLDRYFTLRRKLYYTMRSRIKKFFTKPK